MADEKTFLIGATIKISVVVKDDGAYYTPTPSSGDAVTVTIYNDDAAVVTDQALSADDTGRYSWGYDSSSAAPGLCKAIVTITDGTDVTMRKGFFKLERE